MSADLSATTPASTDSARASNSSGGDKRKSAAGSDLVDLMGESPSSPTRTRGTDSNSNRKRVRTSEPDEDAEHTQTQHKQLSGELLEQIRGEEWDEDMQRSERKVLPVIVGGSQSELTATSDENEDEGEEHNNEKSKESTTINLSADRASKPATVSQIITQAKAALLPSHSDQFTPVGPLLSIVLCHLLCVPSVLSR